jgi:DUF971 family protein
MKATFHQVIGIELAVVWEDGHESYYPLEPLRRACPCANCSGEPDLFGRISKGAPTAMSARSWEVTSIEAVGNYGIQINWADGHGWGIWTFERLRAICPCEACRAGEEASTES